LRKGLPSFFIANFCFQRFRGWTSDPFAVKMKRLIKELCARFRAPSVIFYETKS
jgi:hypothetical protein